MEKITIAIDGYSSCGKSTLAKEIARELNYIYIDSGAMYRAVTLHLMNKGIIKDHAFIEEQALQQLANIDIDFHFDSQTEKSETLLNGVNVEKEIRSSIVSREVSAVSALKEVREKLVDLQQKLGQKGGVVMDGRDIGTVVFPNAEIKLFMTASNNIRAERRYKELIEKGENISKNDVGADLARRDHIDMTREISPLSKATDAIEIDNSNLTREEQLDLALKYINEKIELAKN
ncbi:(d)CMP kinase [Crocinitomix catalasitica]|uniref:(d)CMP kinase n=1 Tax=Crocinitomix catalasitica TaxID=184607 RepID=UPI0004841F73|nr:(d)CMP kinase [Crocinitomix catalasitica]